MRVSGHDESATAAVCTKIMYHHINCIVYVLITLNHGQSAVFYTHVTCPVGPYMTLNQAKTHPQNATSGVDFGV